MTYLETQLGPQNLTTGGPRPPGPPGSTPALPGIIPVEWKSVHWLWMGAAGRKSLETVLYDGTQSGSFVNHTVSLGCALNNLSLIKLKICPVDINSFDESMVLGVHCTSNLDFDKGGCVIQVEWSKALCNNCQPIL